MHLEMKAKLSDPNKRKMKITYCSRSIEKMTENMELLRWQTEAAEEVTGGDPGATYNLTTGALREHGNQWAGSAPSPRRAHRSPSPAAGPRRTMYPMQRGSESPSVQYMQQQHCNSVEAASDCYNNNNTSNNINSLNHPGQLTPKAPSPARSEMSSVPGSPSRSSATTPWALRGSRTSSKLDCPSDAQTDSDEKSTRGSSSFSRFYSRTRSGSIGGSFG